jgi:phosphohistidine phosphatase
MADPVELYLVRHAIAAERGDAWPDDSKRPLTSRGIARFRKEVDGLVALKVRLDLVLTSPLVRAKQTAEILSERLSSHPPIATADALAPGGAYASLLDELARHARRSRIALVGHEPGIGEFAGRLAGTRTAFEFKKGAVCCIDVDALPPARPGRLRWFATPGMLRALAK